MTGGPEATATFRTPTTLATHSGARYAGMLGIGAYRPVRVVDNHEICERMDSSDEWIRERTGIVERRWAGPDESVVSMSVAAGGKAIASAGITPEQVDFVLVATVSHPYQTPSAAAEVAYQLGTPRAAALDISAACAGFCHGVALANDLIRGGSATYVLVVGVEKITDFVDATDRSVGFIFGDGAGAVVIGPSERPAIGPTVWGSDGSQPLAIAQIGSWVEARGGDIPWPTIQMQGQTVFRWAVWQMAPVAQQALDAAGITAADLDAFIPHQANVRIIDAMAKKLGLPEHVAIARDIVRTGNTSAASVPLAMERLLEAGEIRSGDTALLIGFGAGLSYAAQVVTVP
jgi:3-oxoacyl-[acyl-carrier-protein] synthase-3